MAYFYETLPPPLSKEKTNNPPPPPKKKQKKKHPTKQTGDRPGRTGAVSQSGARRAFHRRWQRLGRLREFLSVRLSCPKACLPSPRPPRWPSGKASSSRAEDPGFESRSRRDFFGGRVMPVTRKLAIQWLPCQAPGVTGSALGLVGPVSVYCDWVR